MTTLPDRQPWFRQVISKFFGEDAVGALGRGALATMFVNVAAPVLGLGLHVLLTWTLGDDDEYGIYLLAVTTANLIAIPLIAGCDTALTRFLSQYAGDENAPKRIRVIRWAIRSTWIRCALLVPAVVAVLVYVSRYGLPAPWSSVTWLTLLFVSACIPLLAFSVLRQGALRGLHRPALSTLPESVVTPIAVILVTLVLLAVGFSKTGTTAILAYLVATTTAFCIGLFLLPAPLRRAGLIWKGSAQTTDPAQRTNDDTQRTDKKLWTGLAYSALIMALAFTILSRIDEWLLGLIKGPGTAGLYGPASRFAVFILFGLNAVNPMLGPLVARHQHDPAELQRLAKRAARLAVFISTPIAIFFMALPWVPLSVLPEPYMATACVLRVLAAAQWINTLYGSVGMLLAMTGHHRDLAIIMVVSAIVDIVLNLVLIPPLGYLGAAIATAVSIVGWNTASWVMCRIRLGINPSAV